MMKYLNIQYRLLVFTLLILLFFSGDIKKLWKKALEMTIQLVIFRAFIRPLDPKSETNPLNQLTKQSGLRIVQYYILGSQL